MKLKLSLIIFLISFFASLFILNNKISAHQYCGAFTCPATGQSIDLGSQCIDSGDIVGTISTNPLGDPMVNGSTITVTAQAQQQSCSDVTCLKRSNSQTLTWNGSSSNYGFHTLGCSGGACNNVFTVTATTTDSNCSPVNQTIDNLINGTSQTANLTFTCTRPLDPTVILKVNNSDGPVTINHGSNLTIVWSPENSTSCTAETINLSGTVDSNENWTGSKSASGGTETRGPMSAPSSQEQLKYKITCTNGSIQATDEVQVNINPPVATADLKVNNVNCPATVSVPVGGNATLSWTSDNATSCTASGDWSGTRSTSGSEVKTYSTAGTRTYNLSCSGSPIDTCSVDVTTNPSCSLWANGASSANSGGACTSGQYCVELGASYANMTLPAYQSWTFGNGSGVNLSSQRTFRGYSANSGTYNVNLNATENSGSGPRQSSCGPLSIDTSAPPPSPPPGTGGPTPTPTPAPPPPPGIGEVRVSFFNEDGITPYNGTGTLYLLNDTKYTDNFGNTIQIGQLEPDWDLIPSRGTNHANIYPSSHNTNENPGVCDRPGWHPYMDPGYKINADGTFSGCPDQNIDPCCTGPTETCWECPGYSCQTQSGYTCTVYESGSGSNCPGGEKQNQCTANQSNDVCMGYNQTQSTGSFPRCFSPEEGGNPMTINASNNRYSVAYSSNNLNYVRRVTKAFSAGAPTGYQLQVYSLSFGGGRTLIKSFTQTQNGITNYWASDWTKVSGNETWLGYDVLVKPTTPPPPPAGPWWQTKDADVQSSGNITSNIPQQCVASSQCTEQFGLSGNGGYPGVPAASGTTTFGQGTPNPRNWDVEGSPYTGRRYDYSYFASLAPPAAFTDPASLITNTQISGGNLVSGYQSGGYVWRYRNGDLTINSTANLGNNKTILFINGNLTIGSRITLTKGQGFFAAIVSGNINVSSSVTHTGQKAPGNSGPGLEGIYLANGTINTGTAGTGDDQLYARGSLVGLGGVNLQRNLSGSDDDIHPAEFIEYAPDLVFTFPRDLLRQGIVWREIAP